MADLDAGWEFNDDLMFNLEYVMETLGYTDTYETIMKYCPNTPAGFLKRGRVNEADLCRLLANAPKPDEAEKLEAWIVKYNTRRPLRPRGRHAGRKETRRMMMEERRREERLWQASPQAQYYFVDDDDPEQTPRPVTVSTYPGLSFAPKDWFLPDDVDEDKRRRRRTSPSKKK